MTDGAYRPEHWRWIVFASFAVGILVGSWVALVQAERNADLSRWDGFELMEAR